MKYVSLFSGIGGFDLALNRLGHVCVWANEWDKYAASIYSKNFRSTGKNEEELGVEGRSPNIAGADSWESAHSLDTRDIRTVPTEEIPDHELLVGGFPCQAFSIAGKRRGFDDTRGTLFFEIARILKDKQPKYFILENVKGLLSHDNGNTFKTIITTLTELGYDLQWQVLNSKNFGVPQNRERVFIVGNLRGERRPEVFPITRQDRQDDESSEKEQSRRSWVSTLDSRYGERWSTETYVRHPLKFLERNQKNIEGDYSFTIDGANTGGVRRGTRIRRLTPKECERLQGFPDGWTEGISDTQRYKCLGNAVTVNVVYEIARRLG